MKLKKEDMENLNSTSNPLFNKYLAATKQSPPLPPEPAKSKTLTG